MGHLARQTGRVRDSSYHSDLYARGARFYDSFLRFATYGPQHTLRRAVVRRLEPCPGDFVLDLACGTGLNLPQLRREVGPSGSILGVDLSADMLTRAAARRAAHHSGVPQLIAHLVHT